MWYSIINDSNERYFINEPENNKVCFTDGEGSFLEFKTLNYLKQNNFRIVGEAFEDEQIKIEKGIKLSILTSLNVSLIE